MTIDRRLNLVENGIFPLVQQTKTESTGYDVAGTFQGEGKLIGTPCLFIRTSGCNLRCAWVGSDGNGSPCDTPYSSHNPERNMMKVSEIVEIVDSVCRPQKIRYVVISGGEPTIQTKPLIDLCLSLHALGYHITIETNGTEYHPELIQYVNLWSVSPKLSSSTPWEANLKNTGIEFDQKWAERHERERINIDVLDKIIDYAEDYQLKFVISEMKDIFEIEDILSRLDTFNEPSNVILMPEGVTADDLMQKTPWIAQEALKRGWRFTPRLHILMFGKNRYV